MPVEGIISGVYGSQRILNGKPRWPHYGIDIAAKQGTMIKSSGSGIVTMAEDDLYYTGGTVIMDHGHGISTIYSHLENVFVAGCYNGSGIGVGTLFGEQIAIKASNENSKEIETIEARNKPTWLPPDPILSLGVRARLFYERFRAKSDI